MDVTVIEPAGQQLPDAYWKHVLLYLEWKTDCLLLRLVTFEDSIYHLN